MALESNGIDVGFLTATTDLSAKQFYAVQMSTVDLQVSLVSSTTGGMMGVLQNKPSSGQAASIRIFGVSKVSVGVGGFTPGMLLQCSTAGDFIAYTSGPKVGESLVTASSGNIGTMRIIPSQSRTT